MLNKKPKTRDKTTKNKKQIPTKRKTLNSFSELNLIYPSIIIFIGFITFSGAVIFLTRQFQPLLENQRLKLLCTYQLGDKKSQSYKESKLELEKLVGDSDKYCKNFLLPKEKTKKGFKLFPIMRNILFRFI